MQKAPKVLYITFIDFSKSSESGSSVRPKRMYEAFEQMGYQVVLITGASNKRKERKGAVTVARRYLQNDLPDICYIEPPSGPIFFKCDRQLIKKIHELGIPIGFFYRDIYWRFPMHDFVNKRSIFAVLKEWIIKAMQHRDFRLIQRYVSKIYLPSQSVNNYIGLSNYGILPPGCQEKDCIKVAHSKVTGIFVGGATERYGMGLLLKAWAKIAPQDAELIIVCPREQWENWVKEWPVYRNVADNVHIYHLCDGQELDALYQISDFGLIPLRKTKYNDIAVPIKLYEYVANRLPIVTTNCTETEEIIKKYGIGIVCGDNEEEYSAAIEKMIYNLSSGKKYLTELELAYKQNLWRRRAEKVIDDLM